MLSGENVDEPVDSEVPDEPRSIASIILIAILLGPATVMLWLGRGRLALLYFVLQFALAAALFIAVILEWVPPQVLKGVTPSQAFALLQIVLGTVAIVHAISLRRSTARTWFSRWLISLPLPLAVAVLTAFCLRVFFYQPFNIPSGAMIPTLETGDYLLVSKTAYGYGKYSLPLDVGFHRRASSPVPERGDIAVFKRTRDGEADYMMRIVGLPGERVQMTGGVLYIDGEAVKREPIEDYDNSDHEAYGGLDKIRMYRETLPNGVSFAVLDAEPNGPADDTGEYVVPPGHYFVMGDNRDNSFDSRYQAVGYVPYENLIGPATLIFWNSRGVPIDNRLHAHLSPR
jgi:signal peptidase I